MIFNPLLSVTLLQDSTVEVWEKFFFTKNYLNMAIHRGSDHIDTVTPEDLNFGAGNTFLMKQPSLYQSG